MTTPSFTGSMFEITIYKSAINEKITWQDAKYLINKAIKAFTIDMHNEVVDEYTNILRSRKHDRKTIKSNSRPKC